MPSTAAVTAATVVARRPRTAPTPPPAAAVRTQPSQPIGVAMAEGPERDAIVERLQALGWPVVVASDGPGALHLLDRRQPALILLDLWLPQINGLDVLRQAHHPAPAIILSDVASPELVLGAAAAGAPAVPAAGKA